MGAAASQFCHTFSVNTSRLVLPVTFRGCFLKRPALLYFIGVYLTRFTASQQHRGHIFGLGLCVSVRGLNEAGREWK